MATTAAVQMPTEDATIEKKMDILNLSSSQPANDTARPLKVPIANPPTHLSPPSPSELTADQLAKYGPLLATVKGWKDVPSTKGKEGPISEDEIMWLTQECLLRYLRATKWSTVEAAKRLLATLTWRREYGTDTREPEDVSIEGETGKQFIVGYDNAARPCLYMNPGRQNTEPSPRQIHHMVFMIERVLDLAPPGQEKLTLVVNFKTSGTRTAPGIGQGREALGILQNHYPERLGRALILNVPWVVWGFFKLITPFIDPLTKEKLRFNEDLRTHVPPELLCQECAGDLDFVYEHSTYWPALLKLCEERRAASRERWVKGGKNLGESEVYLKGGDAPSNFASLAQANEV